MKIISIGRSETSDIVLDDSMISRRHAMLRIYATGKMEIIDLSQNGTFVNNVRIKPNVPVPVTRKDVISFAHAMQLDWGLVPNPLRLYIYIGAGILTVAAVILALKLFLLKPAPEPVPTPLPTPEPPKELVDTNPGESKDPVRVEIPKPKPKPQPKPVQKTDEKPEEQSKEQKDSSENNSSKPRLIL